MILGKKWQHMAITGGFALWGMMTHASPGMAGMPQVRACTVHWPPYTVAAPGKPVAGTHTEILKRVFSDLGIPLSIHALPWKRCLHSVRLGLMDLVYSASKKPEREAYAHYTDHPLENIGYVIMTNRDEAHGWDENRDLFSLPLPVGAPLGFSINDNLIAGGINPVNKGIVDDSDAVRMLLKRRHVNSIVVAANVADALIRENDPERRLIILQPAFTPPKAYYIAVSKKAWGGGNKGKKLLNLINRAMKNHAGQTAPDSG